MKDIKKLRKLYDLKKVYRALSVGNRFESVAEHCRSSMILADYFIGMMKIKVDRLKVYELLMYHDLVELETGDIPVDMPKNRTNKKAIELKAMKKIKSDMPAILKKKFEKLFHEFEDKKTLESRFANAVEKLDADLHEIQAPKKDFQGRTEKLTRERKQKHYESFPQINEMFEKIIKIYKKNGYFK